MQPIFFEPNEKKVDDNEYNPAVNMTQCTGFCRDNNLLHTSDKNGDVYEYNIMFYGVNIVWVFKTEDQREEEYKRLCQCLEVNAKADVWAKACERTKQNHFKLKQQPKPEVKESLSIIKNIKKFFDGNKNQKQHFKRGFQPPKKSDSPILPPPPPKQS